VVPGNQLLLGGVAIQVKQLAQGCKQTCKKSNTWPLNCESNTLFTRPCCPSKTGSIIYSCISIHDSHNVPSMRMIESSILHIKNKMRPRIHGIWISTCSFRIALRFQFLPFWFLTKFIKKNLFTLKYIHYHYWVQNHHYQLKHSTDMKYLKSVLSKNSMWDP